jgi:hypothetical protein
MSVEMVDIYFSVPRDLLASLSQSEESKRMFYLFMEDILKRVSGIQGARNLKKTVLHSPGMTSSTECAICLEPIRMFSTINILPCRHGFHPNCVAQLTRNHHYQCPVCRTPM